MLVGNQVADNVLEDIPLEDNLVVDSQLVDSQAEDSQAEDNLGDNLEIQVAASLVVDILLVAHALVEGNQEVDNLDDHKVQAVDSLKQPEDATVAREAIGSGGVISNGFDQKVCLSCLSDVLVFSGA